MDHWAAEQHRASRRIYTYFFDRPIPWPAHPEFGAFHTGEVPYVFRTIDRLDRPWEPVDRTLADTMSSYWANFAKKGDPNGAGLARWPEYVPGGHMTMQLGARLGTMSVAEGAKLDFSTDGIAEIARIAALVNERMENIGARRLHTVMTTLLEEYLFDLPDRGTAPISINAEAVRDRLKAIVEDEDLRKYIL